MTLEEIRRYCNSMADKDRSGKTLTEQQFNDYINVVNIEVFNEEYSMLAQLSSERGIPMNQLLFTETALKEFKVYDVYVTITSGEGTIPSDYKHYLSLYTTVGVKRPIDIVSDYDFNVVKNSIHISNPDEHPVAVIYDDKIKIIPSSILPIGGISVAYRVMFNYLKTPITPHYDFCMITSSRVIVYMPVNSYLSGTTLYADDTMAVTLQTGVEHLTATLPHTSDSVEFEWREDVHPQLAKRVLIKMGVSLKDEALFQMTKIEGK